MQNQEIHKPWWEINSLVPFEPCSSICISGMTGSGKTFWVHEFLQNLNGMYSSNPPVEVYYFYGVYQDLYKEIEKLKYVHMQEGLPPQSFINEISADGKHRLMILDDLMHVIFKSTDIELLFTQGCHHKKISVMYLTQNIFQQGKHARTIALNTWYLILFKNLRDSNQIKNLGRQMFPGKSSVLYDAYEDVIKGPFGYLVVDSSPMGNDDYRLRTKVFPNQDTHIYLSKI